MASTVTVHRRREDGIAIVGGLGLLVVCAGFASGVSPAWEVDAFRAINDVTHSFELATWPLQQLGMALAIPIGAFVLWRLSGSWKTPAALLALATLVGWGAANVVREIVNRGRPPSFLADVQLGYDVPDAGPAFPSGHAIVVFSLIMVLSPYVSTRTTIVMLLLALGVMLARVYVGAHMPLDMLGGAAMGVAVGGAANLIGGISEDIGVESRVEDG